MVRWGLVVALAGACSSDKASDGPSPGTDGPGTVVRECPSALAVDVGTGEDAYRHLEPLDAVTMVHGPQGGWHVETAGLVTGTLGQVSIEPRIVLRDSGVQVAGDQQPNYYGLVGYRDTECDGTFYGIRAFLDDTMGELDTGDAPIEAICPLAGQIATLTVEIGDLVTDEKVTSSVDVTLELDPRDIDPCAAL